MSFFKEKSQFHTLLSQMNDKGIIGLDYVIEIHIGNNFESNFHCVLCDENYKLNMIIGHLTTYVHRMNYLKKHYPTAHHKISKMEQREQKYYFLEQVCQSIEDKHGRLSQLLVENTEFSKNQLKFIDKVANSTHIDENKGPSFTELFTETGMKGHVSNFDNWDHLDSISTTNESLTSRFKSPDVVSNSRSPSLSPNDKRYRLNNSYNSYRSKYVSSRSKNDTFVNQNRFQSPRTRSRSYDRHSSQQKGSFSTSQSPLSIRPPNIYSNESYSPVTSRSYKNLPSTSQLPSWRLDTVTSVKHETHYLSSPLASSSRYYDTTPSTSGTELFERRKPAKPSFDENLSIDEPVTIMSVLRSVVAVEDILGNLGPKAIELMSAAITMNKVEAHSSNMLLDTDCHSVTFESIKMKLEGLRSHGLIEPNKVPTVHKTIANMKTLIEEAHERKKTNTLPCAPGNIEIAKTETDMDDQDHARAVIGSKIELALIQQGRRKEDITQVEIERYIEEYITIANAKQHSKIEPKASTTSHDAPEVLPMLSGKTIDAGTENRSTDRHGVPDVLSVSSVKNIDAGNESHSTNHHDAPEFLPVSSVKKVNASNENQSTNHHDASEVLPVSYVKNVDAGNENHSTNHHDAPVFLPVSSVKKVNAGNENHSTNSHEEGRMLEEFSPPPMSDSDLKHLVENFTDLEHRDKVSLINHLKEIEKVDPERVKSFQNLYKNIILNSKFYATLQKHQK